ncbi:MAG: CHAP domain-containing protein [Candidatus Niyogibacteria bacterium]|nr:MAG: CHAP domain-containing protein [Candidatus Niyogibacteria bacterium]
MKKDQKIYIKENDVNFRKPSGEPDGVEKMKAGQNLVFVDGPWFRATKDGKIGWVYADYISETNPNPAQQPQQLISFVEGWPNLYNSPVTVAVREIINNEFGLEAEKIPLNCTEYVQYCIKTKLGIVIEWPSDRPRHGGKWADIFRRNNLYKVINEPVSNCAACFTDVRKKDGTLTKEGHVAFVEEIFPDGSIKISEANWPNSGIYSERILSKADWQNKYRCRFIDFL